ncbi:MAG: ABC transporter ATP-binding protein, partial [Acidimicrobiales bacterium]
RAGIVLQECGMDDYLSVAEMLRMHAELYPHPRPVDATIDLVGLETKANSRVKSLSGGQKRRLDLALGLIGDPELLFLDEPTTGFDPSARRAAWEVVRNLCGLGKTVLLTTHYMDEAQFLANRVVVMNQGEVVAEGPPDSIGGRARADAEIRFILPAGAGPADLPVDATVEDNGGVVLSTSEPTRDLYELTRWALDRHVALEALSVTRPSLEDVYLSLTASPHDREPHDREPHEREPTP